MDDRDRARQAKEAADEGRRRYEAIMAKKRIEDANLANSHWVQQMKEAARFHDYRMTDPEELKKRFPPERSRFSFERRKPPLSYYLWRYAASTIRGGIIALAALGIRSLMIDRLGEEFRSTFWFCLFLVLVLVILILIAESMAELVRERSKGTNL